MLGNVTFFPPIIWNIHHDIICLQNLKVSKFICWMYLWKIIKNIKYVKWNFSISVKCFSFPFYVFFNFTQIVTKYILRNNLKSWKFLHNSWFDWYWVCPIIFAFLTVCSQADTSSYQTWWSAFDQIRLHVFWTRALMGGMKLWRENEWTWSVSQICSHFKL